MDVVRVWSVLILVTVVPWGGWGEGVAPVVGQRFHGLFGRAGFAAEYSVAQTEVAVAGEPNAGTIFRVVSPGYEGVVEGVLVQLEEKRWRFSWDTGPFPAGEVMLEWVSTRHGHALGGRFMEPRPERPKVGLVGLIGIECEARENPFVPAASTGPQIVPKSGGTVKSFSTENGLASNAVRCLAQTPDGYLWVGTVEGLNRFDGMRWEIYGPESTPRLPDTVVSDLFVDQSGGLIVGTKAEGVYRFFGDDFLKVSEDPVLLGRRVGHLVEGLGGDLWCTLDQTDLARIQLDGEVRTWSVDELNPVWAEHTFFPNNVFSDILPIDPQEVAVIVAGNIIRLNPGTNHWRYERDFSIVDGHFVPGGSWEESFFTSVDSRLTPVDTSLPAVRLNPIRDLSGFPRRAGGVWIVHPKRLASLRDGVLTEYSDVAGPWHLGAGALEDREGSLWVFDGSSGLHRVRFPPVEVVPNPTIGDREESGFLTIGVAEDRGVAVSSLHSNFVLNQDGWEAMDPLAEARRRGLPIRQAEGFDRLRNQVLCVDPRNQDRFWFGFAPVDTHWEKPINVSRGAGLPMVAAWEGEFLQFFACPARPHGVEWVHSIGVSESLGVFVATKNGVFRKRHTADVFSSWNEEVGLAEFDSYCVFVDANDHVWIGGSESGLFRVSIDVVERWSTSDGMARDTVFAVCTGPDGEHWIGTNRGLSRVNADGDAVAWTTQAPFLDGPIYSILFDGREHLWMGTPRGIVGVAIGELERVIGDETALISTIRLGVEDGLVNANARGYYFPSACRMEDGRLWFAMEGSLIRFDPQFALTSAVGPEVRLLACLSGPEVYWEREGKRWGEAVPTLRLPPEAQAALAFDYHALTFVEPRETDFEARLEGIETEWQAMGNQRRVTYPRLAPGDYRFQVRARNSKQIPSLQTAEVAFSISPYFYQTWTFIGGAVILVLLLVYGLHVWRMRYREQIGALEQRIVLDQERSRIARDMHDDLGSTLARVRLRCEMADTLGEHMPDSLARDLKDVSRESMDSLRQIVWSLNIERSEYGDVVQFLREFVAGYFEGTGIEARVRAGSVEARNQFSAAFKRDLILIVKGIVSNVLRHSRASAFSLGVQWEGECFVVTGLDNGIGVSDPVESPGSLGLQSLRERAESWNGTLRVAPGSEGGTSVRIELDPYAC